MLVAIAAVTSAQGPNKNLEPLGFLTGDWEGKFTRKNRAGNDEAVTATVKTRWRLQGQFLELEETQAIGKSTPTTTLLLVTYDPDRKAYQGYIFTSSFPNFPMSVVGEVTQGKLVLKVDAETSPVKASFIYERLDDGKYRGSSSIMAGDKEMTESAVYNRINKG